MARFMLSDLTGKLKATSSLKKFKDKLNADNLSKYKGFENMPIEMREEILVTLREFARTILLQLNRKELQ